VFGVAFVELGSSEISFRGVFTITWAELWTRIVFGLKLQKVYGIRRLHLRQLLVV